MLNMTEILTSVFNVQCILYLEGETVFVQLLNFIKYIQYFE